ncbi:MAG: hypothetical protein ACI3ZD_07750 [Prevotella sp.]
MRKQLMTGVAAAAICLGLTNCSRYDFTPISEGEQAYVNYEKAFTEKFGEPAPDQTWGFGSADANNGGTTRAMTRTASPNANMWASDWNVPQPLTDAQKDIVRRFFQQNKNPQGVAIDYTNFFVQDVYKGGTNTTDALTTEKYQAANGSEVVGSNQMDKLTAGSDNDHINNYNNAQCSENKSVWGGELTNPYDQNSKVFYTDKIMLMENSKTDCFGYYNSLGSAQYNDQYVIISGNTIMDWARTNNKELNGADVSDMFFVGFDYDALIQQYEGGGSNAVNTNQWLGHEVAQGTAGAIEVNGKWYIEGGADGYYSDWIVRITEGILKGKIRIIAEDLSASEGSDFDFNDVVFDVQMNWPSEGKHTITLLAAGGTLPLTIAGEEVHEKFGVATNKMVNTESWTEQKAPVTFIIEGNYTNANEIEVRVQKGSDWPLLTAPTGKAASKIAVSTDYKWVKELQDITNAYSDFDTYVTTGNPAKWWKSNKDDTYIYNAQ